MKTLVRVIHYVSEDGKLSKEGVFFTEDFEISLLDVIPHGCQLQSDQEVEIDTSKAFPLDSNLER